METLREMLIRYKPKEISDSPLLHLGILNYELGDLSKCIVRSWWNPVDGETKLAIGDAITQLKFLAEFFKLDFRECEELGIEHLVERLSEARKR